MLKKKIKQPKLKNKIKIKEDRLMMSWFLYEALFSQAL